MAFTLVSLMHPFYGSLLLFIMAVVLLQRKCWLFIWQLNGWRGVIQQPILWILLMCHLDPKSIMLSIQRVRNSFQFPLAIILFNRILLYVDDPVTVAGILTAPECLNKTFMQNGFYANKGLLHAKDEKWKIRRKQLNPAFSHSTLISLLDDFNRIGRELALKMGSMVQQSENMPFDDLEELVSRAVLEVACLTVLGASINFTESDDKGIASAYRYLMKTTALRILKPWYQIDFLFCLLNRRKYEKAKKSHKHVEAFVANIVQQKHMEWQEQQQQQQRKQPQQTLDENVGVKISTATVIEPQHQTSWHTGYGCAEVKNGSENKSHQVETIVEDAPEFSAVAEHRIFIDQLFYLVQTGKLTLQEVMNEAQSMMVVSFETVSTCVINALLCLAINRDCQMKLRQEIKHQLSNQTVTILKTQLSDGDDNVLVSDVHVTTDNCTRHSDCTDDGNAKNYVDVIETVTMSHLHCMPYLDMVLNESLRLLSTVPINLRNVNADFRLNVPQRQQNHPQPQIHQRDSKAALQYSQSCCGTKTTDDRRYNNVSNIVCERQSVTVPKDTMIAIDMFNMHRNKDYWGINASSFDPQRFAKDVDISAATRHSYAFIPFSKGLRTCIGHRYSVYLSKIILCKLIPSFDFTTSIELKDLQYCEGVSLKYRNSKDIQFTVRQVPAHDEILIR